MTEPKKSLYLSCNCGCSATVVVEKWEDDDYSISIQDSRAFKDNFSILKKIKNAFSVLFGKPIYYTEIWVNSPDNYKKFVDDLQKLI